MRNLSEKILRWSEKGINRYLLKNLNIMPRNFRKFIISYYPNAKIRKIYFESMGGTIGENSFFNMGFIVSPNNDLSNLVIGKNVSIAPNVTCICESNANNGQEINTYPYIKETLTKNGKIIIHDEVWIGANVTILPGVTIGKCTVIGAGSVVSKNLDAFSVYAGVPAKKIRDIRTGERYNVE